MVWRRWRSVLKRRKKRVKERHTVYQISREWSYKKGCGVQGCKAHGRNEKYIQNLAGSVDEN